MIKWDRHTQEAGELVRGKQQLPNSALSGRPSKLLGEKGSALVIHKFLGDCISESSFDGTVEA